MYFVYFLAFFFLSPSFFLFLFLLRIWVFFSPFLFLSIFSSFFFFYFSLFSGHGIFKNFSLTHTHIFFFTIRKTSVQQISDSLPYYFNLILASPRS